MKDFLAKITRQLYILPGGYYVYKIMSKIFPPSQTSDIKIIETPFHFKIKVDLSKYLGFSIFWRGAHDWSTIFVLKNFVEKDDIIFDIGANIGEYTLYAASLVNSNGKVYSFEPVQSMFYTLKQNVDLNSHLRNKIICVNKGLGNKKVILPIYDEQNNINEGLFSIHQKNFIHSKKIQDIEIDTLDNFVNENYLDRIDFIKIDVEGHELYVLQGGIDAIKKFHPKLMIEMSEKNFNAAGYSKIDIFKLLEDMGYSIFLILKRGQLKKVISSSELPEFCNILAIPK
ncbi:MAG: FkbM family methyltransferase [Bacteroidota bacterium]